MQKEVIRWPAQGKSIFRDDERLFGRRPNMGRLEDFFGKRMLWYGCMAASKTGQVISELDILQYFQPAGFEIKFFLPKVIQQWADGPVSRKGQRFNGEIYWVDSSDDIRREAGDRVKRTIVAIGEVNMLDSGIIDLSYELASDGNSVLMEGLDLSFRGEYFPFKDYQNGRTMEDLIRSIPAEHRFPQSAFCTAPINDNDDRCRERARFTQRFLPNGDPAPWYDPLIKVRDYTERTGHKKDDAPDKYRAMCARHLQVPHSELPQLLRSMIQAAPGINQTTLGRSLKQLGIYQRDVKPTLDILISEQHIRRSDQGGYHVLEQYTS